MREEEFVRGRTQYELSNHLGNVLVTISDNRVPVDDGTYDVLTICPSCLPGYPCLVCYNEYIPESGTADGIIDYYTAVVLTANDYYPFGMGMPGRRYSADGAYRYGFNGKENDNESGESGRLNFGKRVYDSRIGRWLSQDRFVKPHLNPYGFAAANPTNLLDPDGNDEIHFYYITVAEKHVINVWDSKRGGLVAREATVNRTYRWIEIIQNNNKDQFFVHRIGTGAPEEIQFYPNVGYGSNTSNVYLNIFGDGISDISALHNIVDDFPELREQVTGTIMYDGTKPKSARVGNVIWWNEFYGFRDRKAAAEREKEQINEMMLGIVLLAIAPESYFLPTARSIFGGGIGGKALAELYALGKRWKGFVNANKLISNNKVFDLFDMSKRAIVDVTTIDVKSTSKSILTSNVKDKIVKLSEFRNSFFVNRNLQIYVPGKKYTKKQIENLKKAIDEFMKDNEIDNVKYYIDEIY